MNRFLPTLLIYMLGSIGVLTQAQSLETFHVRQNHYTESDVLQSFVSDKRLPVKIIKFTFKKIDEHHRILEFTPKDALAVEQYFLIKDGVLSCSSHFRDKTIEVITNFESRQESVFPHKKIAEELLGVGYKVTGLHCRYEEKLFKAQKRRIDIDKEWLETARKQKQVKEQHERMAKYLFQQFNHLEDVILAQ